MINNPIPRPRPRPRPGIDYQIKLACANCGSVIRQTATATLRSRGYPKCNDGGIFTPAPRRTYTRRTSTAVASDLS